MGRQLEDFDTDDIIGGNLGSATESSDDEIEIIADQDQTGASKRHARDLTNLEDEPDEFIRGEVDVKTQMDRTTREMDLSIQGIRDNSGRGLQTHGLEEVAAATDRAMAEKKGRKKPIHH
jgi:hypothetical protein